MFTKTAGLWFVFAAAALTAQETAPIGVLKGDLLAWTGTVRTGQFTFHGAENRLYSCSYDDKTYFERENQRITIAATEKGDRVEILSDHKPGSNVCYARTVHILDMLRIPAPPGVRPRLRTYHSATEFIAPRGDLTFSGVVLRVMSDTLILRSRSGEHKIIRLRADTRYLTDGQTADRSNVPVNTLVFVRAGRNLDDEVEAYQVIWGEILQPQE